MLLTRYSLQCQVLLRTVQGRCLLQHQVLLKSICGRKLQVLLKKVKSSDNVKHSKSSADESCIERFLKEVSSGAVCFCAVCNRCLYKSNVVLFNKEKYHFE